jgi:hypothetical protein
MLAFLYLQLKLPDPSIFFEHDFSFLIKNNQIKRNQTIKLQMLFMVLVDICVNIPRD